MIITSDDDDLLSTIIRQVPDCEEEAVLICPQADLQTGQILSYHDLYTYNIHLTLTLTR